MFVNFNILNQLGSPAINSNTFANRPAAGQTGRLFVSTDTFEIYRDNGTTWDLIGGPGTSTITGTGTATQVAYFTSSQAIGSSSNLYWDNTNIRLGIGTSTPGVRLDVHGTGIMMHINATSATANSLMAFQRTGTNVWRLGDNYNAGDNYFELRNSVLSNDALTIQATTNKAAFLSQQTYLGGQAQGALFTYNLTAAAGTTFATPNALSAVNAYLNLSLGGNATLPAGTRQGIEGNSRVSFTGAGTLTMSQGSTLRAYAAITGVHSFAGSAVGTITHLAGMRLCFPDNIGSAINITNNYGLLINDQSAGTGTITYSNRWGIYQEGASDLNYFAANTLIGTTVNAGYKLDVNGTGYFSGALSTAGQLRLEPSAFGSIIVGSRSSQIDFQIYNTGNILRIYNGTSDVLNINTSGNVGIGTTSPEELLELSSSNTTGGQLLVESTGSNTGDYAGMRFKIAGGSNGGYEKAGIFAIRGSGGFNDLSLIFATNTASDATNVTSANERMRITSGGNVGIGTTSPNRLLDVNGVTRSQTFDVYANSTLSGFLIQERTWVGGTSTNLSLAAETGNALTIFTNGSATERMRVATSGNVLIGTTTDNGNKLQVIGNTYLQGDVNVGYGGPSADRTLSIGTSTNYYWSLVGFGNNFKIQDAAATSVMEFVYNGGIQTNSYIRTGTPNGGTAGQWKFGSYKAAAVTLNTANYIELDIGGTLYKLAVVT